MPTSVACAGGTTVEAIDDQREIISRIEKINRQAGSMVVDVIENATERACEAIDIAATTVQMTFMMAAMRKRDELLDQALTEIENRRIEIQKKLVDTKLSKALKSHYEKQLKVLDDREAQTLSIYEGLSATDVVGSPREKGAARVA